jgi:exopolysaccharide production protein ExoZ
VGWTLNYEMLFYTLFALTLFVPPRQRLALLTAMFTALVAAGLIFRPETAALKFWTRPLILEFLVGAWVGALWLAPPAPRPRLGWALIVASPILLLLISWIAYHYGIQHPDTRVRVALPAIALLVGMLLIEEGDEPAGRLRPLVRLGDASYSLYLWHKPAMSVAAMVALRLDLGTWLTLALILTAGLFAGLAAHLFLERPLLAFFRRRRTRRDWPVPAGV